MTQKLESVMGKVECAQAPAEFDDDAQKSLKSALDAAQEYCRMHSFGVEPTPFCREIMSSDKSLHGWTGFNKKSFSLIWQSFKDAWEVLEYKEIKRREKRAEERIGARGPVPKDDIIAHKANNIPLVRDDPIRRSAHGNRCKLDPVYILLMSLIRKYHNIGEELLGAVFNVDQGTVSRNLNVGDRVLEEALPTPKKFLRAIREAGSPEEFFELFPEGAGDNVILFDGTHVRFFKPSEAAKRDPMMSRKKNFTSGNTIVMTTRDGLIIGISMTYAGRTHDFAITREFLEQLGDFGRMLKGKQSEDDPEAPEAPGSPLPIPDSKRSPEAPEAPKKDPETPANASSDNDKTDVAKPVAATETATATEVAVVEVAEHGNNDKKKKRAAVMNTVEKETCAQNSKNITAPKNTAGTKAWASAVCYMPNKITRAMQAMFDTRHDIVSGIARAMMRMFGPPGDSDVKMLRAIERLHHYSRYAMQVIGDKGFQGLAELMKGADAFTPIKKPRKGELSLLEKEYNRVLGSIRIKVEHSIGAIKQFKRASETYNGSLEEFNREFNVAAGLANFRHMIRNGTYEHWSKKLDSRASDRGR